MRASICLTALVLALSLVGNAPAQTSTATNTYSTGSPGVDITSYIINSLGLTNLFASYSYTAKTQIAGPSNIPDPNSPAYLQAFGFQRLYTPK